jgi:phosphatidylserine/phosphatidylglycerophosphate/cardiolipin synthase-like enzyme/uncharacterized membrane protein YdjX (TVP38/TMEM64 family)
MSDRAAEGTLLRCGENCCAIGRAARFAVLVDGAAYFEAFRRAAERAQRSILILAWDFDSSTPVAWNDGGTTLSLGDFLNALVDRKRQLEVRVLDWDYPLIYGLEREIPPVYGLGWKPHRRVHIRYDGTHPVAASQHQKIALIDDALAFVGGLDLAARRWDTPQHQPHDPRRVAKGKEYPPFHDVMAAVDGDAARELACIARERWRLATGEVLPPVSVEGDPWPRELPIDFRDARLGVACTVPAREGRPETREVEQLYLDMIARARRYVYMENQYFTSRRLGEALAARLAEPDGPEIVLVTRLLSHGWLEEVTMHALRARLVRDLRAADPHGRFHVYYPHREGLAEGTCVDMHAKLMVVDDEWLRIGSSNLSNRSMGLDTECDVVLEAEGRPGAIEGVKAVRDRLLAEHLGAEPVDVARQIERTGSITGAIAALRSEGRTLRELENPEQLPEAVVEAIALSADPERPVALDALIEQFAPDTDAPSAARLRVKALAAAALLLALVAAWRFTPLAALTGVEEVVRRTEALGRHWWMAPLLVVAYTPSSFVMFPRALLTLVGVVAFGPWLAFGLAMCGSLLAATIGYLAGRRLERDTVRRVAGERLNRISHALRRRGLLAITAVRLVPLGPFAVQNVVAGAVRVRFRDFLLATLFGMLPGTLITTVFGDQLKSVLLGAREIDHGLVLWIALALLALGWIVRRLLTRKLRVPDRAGGSDGPRLAGRGPAAPEGA